MPIESITDVISRMQSNKHAPRFVENWKARLPPGSRWSPGMHGDPACPSCLGIGYVRLDSRDFESSTFGTLYECECAHGKGESIRALQMTRASRLDNESLKLRYAHIRRGAITPAVQAVRETVKRGGGWVFIWGNYGTGKSLLARTTVAECLNSRQPAVYALWSDVLADIRDGFKDGVAEDRLADWRSIGVLVLDEVSRYKSTEWTDELIPRLITARYEDACANRTVTIFVCNEGPATLPPFWESRVNDGRFEVVNVLGNDVRPAMEYGK